MRWDKPSRAGRALACADGDLFDFSRATPVADRLVELAKANHARLAAS